MTAAFKRSAEGERQQPPPALTSTGINVKRLIRQWVGPCLVLSCLLSCRLAHPQSAPAAEEILDYHSDIRVQKDASLLVRETIRVRSAGRLIKHGIYRDFPTRYQDRLGNHYVITFQVLEARRDGQPENFHLKDLSNGERVYLGNENVLLPPGEYTYTLFYSCNRQLGFFAGHDELYWNVTGNGWVFPILHATALVTLPQNIPTAVLRTEGYTGVQGSRAQNLTSSIEPGMGVAFATTRALLPGEGLTVVVSWPKGYFQEPSRATRFGYFLQDNRSALVGLAGLAILFFYYLVVWLLVGRDPARSSSIMPIYEPPSGVSPAAMRYLVRMGFDNKTFAAAVISMAVKDFLIIKEKDGDYALRRSKAGQQVLSPEESAIAAKLFRKHSQDDQEDDDSDKPGDGAGPGSEIKLQNKNHAAISAAVTALNKALAAAEEKIYFVTNQRYMIPGLIVSVLLLAAMAITESGDRRFVLGFFLAWLSFWSIAVFFLVRQCVQLWKGARAGGSQRVKLAKQARSFTLFTSVFVAADIGVLTALALTISWTAVLILVATVGINLLFHWLLKAPTSAGRQLLDKIEGFRMFLNAVDADRLNRLTPPTKTPELFEEYLPYAVALDSEQAWAEQFSTILNQAGYATQGYRPLWYAGGAGFAAGTFAVSLGSSFSSAIAASSSAPGSSSGIGGGGGFSGGGGGGGGGGGW
jgi:uncharacterized membrane protein YgcG